MSFNIREGLKADLPQVLELIKELADYENAIEEVQITVEELEKDGLCCGVLHLPTIKPLDKKNYQ